MDASRESREGFPADGLARFRISNDPKSLRCAATSQTRPGTPFPRTAINAAVIARYDAVSVFRPACTINRRHSTV
jgi:hypothetical protein